MKFGGERGGEGPKITLTHRPFGVAAAPNAKMVPSSRLVRFFVARRGPKYGAGEIFLPIGVLSFVANNIELPSCLLTYREIHLSKRWWPRPILFVAWAYPLMACFFAYDERKKCVERHFSLALLSGLEEWTFFDQQRTLLGFDSFPAAPKLWNVEQSF